MVAAKRGPPLVEPCPRHQFPGLVRRVFEGRGNIVGRMLRPAYTRTQLRRLTKENRFALNLPLHANGAPMGQPHRLHGQNGHPGTTLIVALRATVSLATL